MSAPLPLPAEDVPHLSSLQHLCRGEHNSSLIGGTVPRHMIQVVQRAVAILHSFVMRLMLSGDTLFLDYLPPPLISLGAGGLLAVLAHFIHCHHWEWAHNLALGQVR